MPPRCAQADREAFLNVRKLCTATERRKRTSGGDKSARRIGERSATVDATGVKYFENNRIEETDRGFRESLAWTCIRHLGREFLKDANHDARPRRSESTRERRAERLGRVPAHGGCRVQGRGAATGAAECTSVSARRSDGLA